MRPSCGTRGVLPPDRRLHGHTLSGKSWLNRLESIFHHAPKAVSFARYLQVGQMKGTEGPAVDLELDSVIGEVSINVNSVPAPRTTFL